jgi:hypothetical protein
MKLLGGKREPEVVLGETLHAASKNGLDFPDDTGVHVHGHECALVEIDAEAGGTSEALEQPMHMEIRRHIRMKDQQRIVCVLENGAGRTANNGLLGDVVGLDQPLQHVGDDEEEVWRERVALPQTAQAGNPLPGDAVDEHGGPGRTSCPSSHTREDGTPSPPSPIADSAS